MGTNWDRLIASWKKLKNSLNWLNKTKGRKLKKLYFWLFTAFDIVFLGSVNPSNLTNLSTFISGPRQHKQHLDFYFLLSMGIIYYELLRSFLFDAAYSVFWSLSTYLSESSNYYLNFLLFSSLSLTASSLRF